MFTCLPYSQTPLFDALLSILPKQPTPTLRFLYPYISPPSRLKADTIVSTAASTPAFFTSLQAYVVKVLQATHHGPILLAFWASTTTEAISLILDSSSSGRQGIRDQKIEELLFRVLPVLNEVMTLANAAEAIIGCYMIIIVLVTKGAFEDKILDSLMEAVILSYSIETQESCLQCLAIIAEERSRLDIPVVVLKQLLRIPGLLGIIQSIGIKCRIERLALGCALGSLEATNTPARLQEAGRSLQGVLESNILNSTNTSICISMVLKAIQTSTPGSSQHRLLLELVTKLSETTTFSRIIQSMAKKTGANLELLGIASQDSLDTDQIDIVDSEDEDMLDINEANEAPLISLPDITETTFLDNDPSKTFQVLSEAFEQVISSKQAVRRFLSSETLRQKEAFQQPLFLSFMISLWCGPTSAAGRLVAIRSTKGLINELENEADLQNLIPYLLCALADISQPVRRYAAACIAELSKKTDFTNSQTASNVWGSKDMYGDSSSKISALSPDQVSELLSTVLVPILEECVMDPTFAITSLRDILQGAHSSRVHQKYSLKSSSRSHVISFLSSHAALTPLLRARGKLFPLFNFVGKSSVNVRADSILPLVRDWCSLADGEIKARCEREKIEATNGDEIHLATLIARESGSIKLISDLISGHINKEREDILDAAFDRLNALWPSIKSESRFTLSQTLLELSLKEEGTSFDGLSRTRSLETLRNVKLDTQTLASFLESVPAAFQMPEGPPAKKRRRTSRSEMARVELQSPEDVSRLLRRLTLVLELVENSNTSQHLPLFKNLFTIFGELQQLKQQSGSDLIYLQNLVLGSLTPIVNKLKVIQQLNRKMNILTTSRMKKIQLNTRNACALTS